MPIEHQSLSLAPLTRATTTARADRHERAAVVGCGWFDSSHDLRLGLEVREAAPSDMRLRDWLDAFLGAEAPGENAQRAFAVALPSSITAIA